MKSDFNRLLAEYPLETLLQNIPTGLFLVDTDYRIVYWNDEAERITGYTAAETVGQHCSFLDGVPCSEECGLFESTTEKPISGINCSLRHKFGRRIDLSKNVDLLRDKQGTVVGGIEAFVDVSRLVKLESSLRAEVEDRTRELELEKGALRSVLDGMSDPVYICDKSYRITFINRAMREMFGDVAGQICHQVMHERSRPCADCPLDEVLAGQEVFNEWDLPETGRSYEIVHTPFPLADNPTHKLGVLRDITERKDSERRLKQANAELDAFVSTVSHDLRSPLTPLIGFAELLEDSCGEQLDSTGLNALCEIKHTTLKMQALLEDLLSLSRVGQMKEPKQPVNANRIAEDVLAELADRVFKAEARITITDLPPIRIPEALLGDLFRNLLGNALKYATVADPRIEICGDEYPDRVRYRVVDHGPGIVEEDREELFEPFRRGDNSSNCQGSGIGLATVAKIARVYGGAAWIEETPGGGATFVVELVPPED